MTTDEADVEVCSPLWTPNPQQRVSPLAATCTQTVSFLGRLPGPCLPPSGHPSHTQAGTWGAGIGVRVGGAGGGEH